MHNKLRTYIAAALVACSCGTGTTPKAGADGAETGNAIYFWKTKFALDGQDSAFLKDHDIKRIYLRYFDVDCYYDSASIYNEVVPNATTSFLSPKPEDIEIVPTVFITPKALEVMEVRREIEHTAELICQRIMNMSSYNEMGPISEVQLDCDWAQSTREIFFSLCESIRKILAEKEISLSVTIRLHQLRQKKVPPADRGVLMLYNTGALRNPDTRNSILSADDVKLYLRGKSQKYALPLDFAYPTYGWAIWFRVDKFMAILHHSDFSDESLYEYNGNGIHTVKIAHRTDGHHLMPGDRIRLETSEMQAIRETASMIRQSFPGRPHRNIIYHMDSNNLKSYSYDEIEEIYHY